MKSDPMTEEQGDRIIGLLERILKELEEVSSCARFDIMEELRVSARALDSIDTGIGNLG